MSVEIEVVGDPARACAAMMVGAASGGGHVVLTGGSTPRAAYEEFVRAAQAVELDLADSHFWFGDERCVAPEDERSNYRLARESLFDPLGDRGPGYVHRMQGELGFEQGAAEYEQQFAQAGNPEFELLLLGLGPDGHCASLFPEQESLQARDRLVVGIPQAGLEPFVPRISLTLPAIASANEVVFLVRGSSKAEAVAAAFGPRSQPTPRVPASLVDPAAAERL
jgi:6-phosphogluconolactonase